MLRGGSPLGFAKSWPSVTRFHSPTDLSCPELEKTMLEEDQEKPMGTPQRVQVIQPQQLHKQQNVKSPSRTVQIHLTQLLGS